VNEHFQTEVTAFVNNICSKEIQWLCISAER